MMHGGDPGDGMHLSGLVACWLWSIMKMVC